MNKSMWQPIETAPKDGTYVLLYIPTPWGSDISVFGYKWGGWLCIKDEFPPYTTPTHWMPLPEAPE